MRLGLVVGTRPEIIKMSPVVRQCQRQDLDFFLVHTGQHYSYNMDGLFFDELDLPKPNFSLNAGSSGFSDQLGKMMSGLERILSDEKPDYVLGEGDTNSVLAAALVASNLRIPFVHLEAGLRSYNPEMQEERNRIIADHMADVLFPPTSFARDVLLKEGINPENVFITGNTITDAVEYYLPKAHGATSIEKFGLHPRQYFLATLHRAENADYDGILRQLLANLKKVSEAYQVPVVFPVHPRTRSRIEELQITLPGCIRMIDPVGFFDFLLLEQNALLVLTDSGGVQEECCILQVPCITLRDDTERPETIDAGGNLLVGRTTKDLVIHVKDILNRPRNWINPLGDGEVARHMIDTLLELNTK